MSWRLGVALTLLATAALTSAAAGTASDEPFTWQGNHAATVHNGAATTVWWNPDNWDVRTDSSYLATQPTGTNPSPGHHVDIHKASSTDPINGHEDNSVYAVGGDGSAGVGTMHLNFQGISSARSRNPMLISAGQPGVVQFFAPRFVTSAHWWELAITPADQVVAGELTAVPSVQDGLIDPQNTSDPQHRTGTFCGSDPLPPDSPLYGANRLPGPGHYPYVDSLNVIAASPSDVPAVTGWWTYFEVTRSIGQSTTHCVTRVNSLSDLMPTDPNEADRLYQWRVEFWPNRVDLFVAPYEHGRFRAIGTYPIQIPWPKVHVHLLSVAYQADHHPQGSGYLGMTRDFHWRDVTIGPVEYLRTSVAPQDGITEIMSRQLGWMAHDLRDTQRYGGPINGAPQPNTAAYRQYGQMAFTSVYQYNGAPAPVSEANIQVSVSADQAAAAAARLLYDIRSAGTGTVYVNGAPAGTIRQAMPRPGVGDSDWERRSLELAPGLLTAGTNQVRIVFSGAIQLDRLQLEFSHSQ